MSSAGPTSIRWSDHALIRAQQLGFTRTDVESAVRDGHARRTRNAGAADWLVRFGRLVVAYNHPDGDDLTALVVTVWRV